MQSAASAQTGDVVRRIGTDSVGIVAHGADDGRMWVTVTPQGAPAFSEKWERWEAEVLSTPETDRRSL